MRRTMRVKIEADIPEPDGEGRCYWSCPFHKYSCMSGSYHCPEQPKCTIGCGEILEDFFYVDEDGLGVEKRLSLGFYMAPGKKCIWFGKKENSSEVTE